MLIKICGIREQASLDAAIEAGADLVGFVFFPRSPRHVDLGTARRLGDPARGRAGLVALTVDADDATHAGIVDALRPDFLQLHGSETPDRVATVKRRFGVPVMKVLPIGDRRDLDAIAAYKAVADRLLFDARPPADASRPGGLGQPFDWRLLAGLDPATPFILSGGLTPDNVAEAIRIAGPDGIDVSSGVERAPGQKDPDLIRAFIRNTRRATTSARTADHDPSPPRAAEGARQ